MHDEVKALGRKSGEVGHVSFFDAKFQTLPLRNLTIPCQLEGGEVKDRHVGPRSSENWPLLSTSSGEAEDIAARERGKPGAGNGTLGGEYDRPVAPARTRHVLARHRHRPGVSAPYLTIPRLSIVLKNVHGMPLLRARSVYG
jgi:hypothetical protein